MNMSTESQETKKWMVKLLQDYGRDFLVFDLRDQPNVFARPEPEFKELKSGNLDPRELRSWRYLDFTLQLLRERYGLFDENRLVNDCPLHTLYPLKREKSDDFCDCFQITAEGTIKFRCSRSAICKRPYCGCRNNRTLDLYDVVALLEKKNREHARKIVSDYCETELGRKLGHFPKTNDSTEQDSPATAIMRFAVPKAELTRLLSIPVRGRGAGDRFLHLALKTITGSPLVAYDGFRSAVDDSILMSSAFPWAERLAELGIASRLFVWVHWRQAEAGSKLRLTDQSVAQALGVDRRTVQNHKQLLVELGYLRIEPADEKMSFWSALYAPKKDAIA